MTLEEIIKAINLSPKGAQRTITQRRAAKTRVAFKALDIKKESILKGRFVGYANQSAVIKKHESGEREQIPNGWTKLAHGVFLDHHGKIKCCFAPSYLKGQKNSSKFILDGNEVDKNSVAGMLLASETKSAKETPDWFTLNVENILSII